MAGVGLNRMNPNPSFQPRQEEGNNLPKPPSISASDLKKLRKAQEKDAKKSAKKAEKKVDFLIQNWSRIIVRYVWWNTQASQSHSWKILEQG